MIFEAPIEGQKFFAPEVVQTSAMDCGPAALKCLLDGFGIPVSYARLREACQTSVDGTSINTLEDIAVQLGLEAEQIMIPVDHLLLEEAQALPALVVVQLPNGLTHFLVVWGQVGRFIQLMDPSTGRRWTTWQRFQNEIYTHTFPVPTRAWREWAETEGMLKPLQRRMSALKIPNEVAEELIKLALADPGWFGLAVLDATVRMCAAIVHSGGLEAGMEASKVLERWFMQNLQAGPQGSLEPGEGHLPIPETYWSVRPILEPGSSIAQPARLLLRGAVLIRVLGRKLKADLNLEETRTTGFDRASLPPELVAALEEPTYQPFREVWNMLRQDGLLTPSILVAATFLASITVIVEALLLQGVLQIGTRLSLTSQRIGAALVLLSFVLAGLLLEFPVSATVLRMGRRLETRLRVAFLEKIPRLSDRYFHSRLTSDMTQRAHDLRSLRGLPSLAVNLIRTTFQLFLTTLGVIWLDPISAPIAILATAFFIGISFLTRPLLDERDLRLRTQTGGLSRFYLDGLLGLIPARTHGAERAMRRQHEGQLVDWVRSSREYVRVGALVQTAGAVLYSIFAIWLVMNYVSKGGNPGEILLLFYWTLNLPILGQSLADLVQQFPLQRNRVLRLLEPLSAPDEIESFEGQNPVNLGKHGGVAIIYQDVSVVAGGQTILQDINLTIQEGEHLAIVGLSGAGKSSLVGLLLGWHRPASGQILVDGQILTGPIQQLLRRQTAWVDPAVQIWNRSMYDNLRYGSQNDEATPIGQVIQQADLFAVLDKLPNGLKTVLGEGGGLVSGGEGQRVRLGRAFIKKSIRLAILDEPFRGLDRQKRRKLLGEARRHWQGVTMITVTHDVGETSTFPRVLVIQDGRIVEDGSPESLLKRDTRYRQMTEAEMQVRKGLWGSTQWRRVWLEEGQLATHPEDDISHES